MKFDWIYGRGLSLLVIARIILSLLSMGSIPYLEILEVKLLFAILVTLLMLVILVFNFRNRYSLDGADQFNSIGVTALSLCLLMDIDRFWIYFLPFIAFQTSISYLIAGTSKLASSTWLKGDALKGIFSGQVYGHKLMAFYVEKWPILSQVLAITVIFWESVFVTIYFGPEILVLIMLGIGFLFHLFNAVFMGLNCFFFSFIAGYPAILFVHRMLAHF